MKAESGILSLYTCLQPSMVSESHEQRDRRSKGGSDGRKSQRGLREYRWPSVPNGLRAQHHRGDLSDRKDVVRIQNIIVTYDANFDHAPPRKMYAATPRRTDTGLASPACHRDHNSTLSTRDDKLNRISCGANGSSSAPVSLMRRSRDGHLSICSEWQDMSVVRMPVMQSRAVRWAVVVAGKMRAGCKNPCQSTLGCFDLGLWGRFTHRKLIALSGHWSYPKDGGLR